MELNECQSYHLCQPLISLVRQKQKNTTKFAPRQRTSNQQLLDMELSEKKT